MAAASGWELLKKDCGYGTSLWAFQPRLYLYWILRLDVANTDDYGMTNQHHYISLSVDRIAEY
jgi:hypothetical protein